MMLLLTEDLRGQGGMALLLLLLSRRDLRRRHWRAEDVRDLISAKWFQYYDEMFDLLILQIVADSIS